MSDKEYIAILERRCKHLKNILYDMHDVDSAMVTSYLYKGMLTPNDARFLLNTSEVIENDGMDILEYDILTQRRNELASHMHRCIANGVPIPTTFLREWRDTCNRLGELRENYKIQYTE